MSSLEGNVRSKQVASLLESAHLQGRAWRVRLRMTTLITGSGLSAVGIAGFFIYTQEVRSAFVAILLVGISILLFSVLPIERRLATGICYVTMLFQISSAAAQTFPDWSPLSLAVPTSACGSMRTLRCAFVRDHSVLPVVLATLVSILSCIVIALRIGWLLARRTSGRHLLDEVWRAFGVGVFTIIAQSIVKWVAAGRESGLDAGLTVLLYYVCIVITALSWSPRLRLRLAGWIAMRGAATSSAGQMAQLMGANSVADDVMKLSQRLLRCVAFDALRPSDFEGDFFPADAIERSRPAQVGEIDAFVSHSWQADPAAKWAVLKAWADEFHQRQGRWPTLWIDRICIEPSMRTASIACLPVFVSASNTLLVLYDDTFLSRLWCVVELFAFLVTAARVGGALVVRRLPTQAADAAGAGGARDASEAQKVWQELISFDARLSECSLARDREHLLDLVDAYPGGTNGFNRAVRTIFARHLFQPSSGLGQQRLFASALRRSLHSRQGHHHRLHRVTPSPPDNVVDAALAAA